MEKHAKIVLTAVLAVACGGFAGEALAQKTVKPEVAELSEAVLKQTGQDVERKNWLDEQAAPGSSASGQKTAKNPASNEEEVQTLQVRLTSVSDKY